MTPLAVLSLQPIQGHSGALCPARASPGHLGGTAGQALQAGDLIRTLEVRTHGRAY